jgi:hypothetical protein
VLVVTPADTGGAPVTAAGQNGISDIFKPADFDCADNLQPFFQWVMVKPWLRLGGRVAPHPAVAARLFEQQLDTEGRQAMLRPGGRR